MSTRIWNRYKVPVVIVILIYPSEGRLCGVDSREEHLPRPGFNVVVKVRVEDGRSFGQKSAIWCSTIRSFEGGGGVVSA